MYSGISKAFAASGYTVFHDITLGSNGGFNAHAGYDNTTGIGSIKGFKFAGVEEASSRRPTHPRASTARPIFHPVPPAA